MSDAWAIMRTQTLIHLDDVGIVGRSPLEVVLDLVLEP
jgi:hypothetical protein